MELFAVVVAGRFFNLCPDLAYPAFQGLAIPGAINDGGIVLVDANGLGSAQITQSYGFKFDALFFTDHLAARQNGNVVQHGFAAVAKTRGLHGTNLECPPQFVDYQGGKRFPFHIFSNNEERSSHLGNLLEDRQEVLHVADFLLIDEDQRFIEDHFHLFRVSHKIR